MGGQATGPQTDRTYWREIVSDSADPSSLVVTERYNRVKVEVE